MPDHSMTPEAFEDLQRRVAEGEAGETVTFACNVNDSDHLHARRLGLAGSGDEGRVAVLTHGALGHAWVFLSAPEARVLASALLNMADELDGTTPLTFFPPRVVDGPDQDKPER